MGQWNNTDTVNDLGLNKAKQSYSSISILVTSVVANGSELLH